MPYWVEVNSFLTELETDCHSNETAAGFKCNHGVPKFTTAEKNGIPTTDPSHFVEHK